MLADPFRGQSVIFQVYETMEGCKKQVHLYRADDLPVDFREPFILSGYRGLCGGSKLRCLRATFFAPSNETFNVVTHLASAAWFIYIAGMWWSANWKTLFELRVEINIFLIAVCIYPIVSASAHVFSCATYTSRHICFFMDYGALSIYALCSAFAYRAYAFPPALLGGWFSQFYLPAAGIIAALSFAGSCGSRFMESEVPRKCIRFLSFAAPCLFDLVPTTYGLLVDRGMFGPDFYAIYCRMIVLTMLSAIVYCLHAPECLFPGYFDFIGHSHQLFHVISTLGSREQINIFFSRAFVALPEECCPMTSTVLCILALVLTTDIIVFTYYSFRMQKCAPMSENGYPFIDVGQGHRYNCSGHHKKLQ